MVGGEVSRGIQEPDTDHYLKMQPGLEPTSKNEAVGVEEEEDWVRGERRSSDNIYLKKPVISRDSN